MSKEYARGYQRGFSAANSIFQQRRLPRHFIPASESQGEWISRYNLLTEIAETLDAHLACFDSDMMSEYERNLDRLCDSVNEERWKMVKPLMGFVGLNPPPPDARWSGRRGDTITDYIGAIRKGEP